MPPSNRADPRGVPSLVEPFPPRPKSFLNLLAPKPKCGTRAHRTPAPDCDLGLRWFRQERLAYQFAVTAGRVHRRHSKPVPECQSSRICGGRNKGPPRDFDSITFRPVPYWSPLHHCLQTTRERILKELSAPLIVVDDRFRTARTSSCWASGTKSRFVYIVTEIYPDSNPARFNESELESFVRSRARAYKTDADSGWASYLCYHADRRARFVDAATARLRRCLQEETCKGDAVAEYAPAAFFLG